ncbi:MAG: hypothetical protein M1401_05685 [Chloroflexi bacterium]|nr:hypothetical protein [Chloroflexota bacterium]
MRLRGVHLLLTYQCTYECDHCFVWGSPRQTGTMTLAAIRQILAQAAALGTQWIYFEGGEPFLYYATLARGVAEAARLGFRVGIVSNAYWATSPEDAEEWLRPFAGQVRELSLSGDLYHSATESAAQLAAAREAALRLGLPVDTMSVAQPEAYRGPAPVGQLPPGQSGVMYRGRAAEALVGRAAHFPWHGFTTCPHEDLREPGRLHVDPFGNLHLCQGLLVGNLFARPLAEICAGYEPATHPVVGPLLRGGPAQLVREYDLPHADSYADACHLCYEARRALRPRFPEVLAPDQMYAGTATG